MDINNELSIINLLPIAVRLTGEFIDSFSFLNEPLIPDFS